MSFFSAVSFSFDDDESDDGFEYEPQPWEGPPANTLGAVVPFDLFAARTPNVVLALTHATVFQSGVRLHLHVCVRRGDMDEDRWYEIESGFFGNLPPRRRKGKDLPDSVRRYGVRFPDGTKAVTVADDLGMAMAEPGSAPPQGPVLVSSGGGGGSGGDGALESEEELWLWPLPAAAGPLEFAVEWPLAGIDLTFVELDAAALAQAAGRARPYWDAS